MPDIYVARKKPLKLKKEKLARTANPLAAFVARPREIKFETQERDEKIIILLRRHWITNIPWMCLVFLLILAPLFFNLIPMLQPLMERYAIMVIIPWYLFILAFILESFLTWYFNVNIVTDERIVDIDFYSLIYKEISHCKIDQIQDITFKMGGVIRTLFDFGDIIIQTASEIPVFEFESVPKPAVVVRKLNELILEEEQEKLDGRVR